MKFFIVVLFFFLGFDLLAQNDSLLAKLNQTIDHRKSFHNEKYKRLQRYHDELSRTPKSDLIHQYDILLKLTNEYKTFIFDSAFSYMQRMQTAAKTLNDPVRSAHAKNQLGLVLLSSGMFKETIDSLAQSSVSGMPDSIKVDYYFLRARLYYDLIDFNRDRFFSPIYNKMANLYMDSVIHFCPKGSYNQLYFRGLKNLRNENNQQALADLNQLLARPNLTAHQLAVTASTLSYYYISRHQPEEAIALLARASIADIESSVHETSAISVLAELLYKKGDIINAYNFIHQAMDDAVFYGARQRKIQVGAILPAIDAAKLSSTEEQRRLWLIYSSLVTMLSILVIVFAIIIFKQLKKRKIAERALQEANKIKEEYIGYYFNTNSEYLNKIEAFKRTIELKLMTKKTEDIRLAVNNINLKKEREDLYNNFDKVFLKLFPDFVTIFNSYFTDENKIVLKEGQLLNTELRIFALIRMGIHDTEKIAKILDYSINTIYNYKARVKSKSLIENDEFEKKVMEIHAL
ncbi:MAG: DUF6377 domain-containing protein [Cyclobacteriaceae bacterium]